ncbi:hypothetical protein [Halomonas sp. LBP4]|uniref:hypothetical protein n=1 Tax=Halomonas sp. LBP4 TaxID=2044917 RepID=UPI000D770346|nr:hypothetical protein [Halomonas sp. LBP4]PXX95980.1 hypothetical protein CR157_17465 [Halomonas sp. LBP4]
MQCSCGGATDRGKVRNGRLKADLEYQVCQACGRVSDAALYIQGRWVSSDLPGDAIARRWFNELTEESADQLLTVVTSLQDVFEEDDSPREPEQAELF